MRMKLFTAPSRQEAITLMFGDMGGDAIILSEGDVENGYEVRAAVERAASIITPKFGQPRAPAPELEKDRYRETLREILTWHGAPDGFADVVANSGSRLANAGSDPASGFSAALEGVIGFAPIAPSLSNPVMLVGPPGSGKTSTTAKLIRRAKAAKAEATPLVADFDATAGGAQLAAYLQMALEDTKSYPMPDELIAAADRMVSENQGVVIDTPAINPCDSEDLERLADLIGLLKVEPVLVLSAEGHPLDLEESVRAFSKLGIRRCILTKLDVVRRRGSVLYAIASGKMNISHLALTPFIGGGLIPATPNRLARILLEDAPGAESLKGAA